LYRHRSGSVLCDTGQNQRERWVLKQSNLVFDEKKDRLVKQTVEGTFRKSGNERCLRLMREFKGFSGTHVKAGDEIKVDMFLPGDIVDVSGKSKGRGFQRRRENDTISAASGMTTHGASDRVRAPGSIGGSFVSITCLQRYANGWSNGIDRVTVKNFKSR